jgi:hypothetical protein
LIVSIESTPNSSIRRFVNSSISPVIDRAVDLTVFNADGDWLAEAAADTGGDAAVLAEALDGLADGAAGVLLHAISDKARTRASKIAVNFLILSSCFLGLEC